MSEMLPEQVQAMMRGAEPRRRGWKRKLRVKHLLNQEGKPDAACAREVLNVLERDDWFANLRGGELLDDMRCAVEEAEETGDIDWFNQVLDDLYDEADEARVWID